MASTYSTSLRLELMATGDQSGTWGDTTNTNLGTLLEQAITGYLSKAMADTNQTLTNLNGASDEARNMVIEATGALTAGRNIVVPTAEKVYLIKNSTTGGFSVTVKTTAGTGVAVVPGTNRWVYCDGTNVVDGGNDLQTLTATALSPATTDALALGTTALMWSDLFLASGGVINWNNGGLTLTQSTETLTQTFTNAAATVGPVYDLYRDSSSPAASDIIGRVAFNGEDSAGNKQEYASIEATITDPTSTSEDGTLDVYVTVGGTRTLAASFSGAGLAGGSIIATQAQQESATGTVNVVTPARQQYHPSAAKAWARVTEDGAGNYTLAAAYNIASVTDNGTGNVTITFDVDFSSAAYACFVTTDSSGTMAAATSPAAGSVVVRIFNTTPTAVDDGFYLVAFGDQ